MCWYGQTHSATQLPSYPATQLPRMFFVYSLLCFFLFPFPFTFFVAFFAFCFLFFVVGLTTANRHKDDKVKKWANGLVDTWMNAKWMEVGEAAVVEEVVEEVTAAVVVHKDAAVAQTVAVAATMPTLIEIVAVLSEAHGMKEVLKKEQRTQVKVALGHAVEHAAVTMETLKSTGLGKAVKRLSKHTDPKVKKWAAKLVQVFISKFAPVVSGEVVAEASGEVVAEASGEVVAEVAAEVAAVATVPKDVVVEVEASSAPATTTAE